MAKVTRIAPLLSATVLALIAAAAGFLFWFLAPLSKTPRSPETLPGIGRLEPKPMPMPEIVQPTGPPPVSVPVGEADDGDRYVPPVSSPGTNGIRQETVNQSDVMHLISPAFGQNESIPTTYTCDGDNTSPPLAIADVPEAAKGLVLIVDDPDASSGTWIHWIVWNLPPDTAVLTDGALPAGSVEGRTSFGRSGYGGPCPPSGTHRYFFKLYALDTILDLPAEADVKRLEAAMEGHILDKSGLVGTYSRS